MTTTINTETISVSIEYKTQDIWNALVGSDFQNTNHWIKKIRYCDDKPCNFHITYIEKTTGDFTTSVLSPANIYHAFAELVAQAFTHCGGYPINDLENSDACFADFVLQQALYGEIVFS